MLTITSLIYVLKLNMWKECILLPIMLIKLKIQPRLELPLAKAERMLGIITIIGAKYFITVFEVQLSILMFTHYKTYVAFDVERDIIL